MTHFCHVFSSFDPGGAEVRTVALINRLGRAVRHTIVATDGRYGAAERIHKDITHAIVPPPPGKGRLLYGLTLGGLLQDVNPDLLLTYNWGAIDAVIGGTVKSIGPILHAEDGFGPEESVRLKKRRAWTRRLFLNRIEGTIVPSRQLVRIVTTAFGVKPNKVFYIPNGIDHARFSPGRDATWRTTHRVPDHALLVGSVGALRPEKHYSLLLEAVARIPRENVWIAFAGDGPCRDDLTRLARELGLASRTVFAGPLTDTAPFYRSLDVFALSSSTEQMPLSVLEAMASGLPIVATDVGDIREMLAPGDQDRAVLVPCRNAQAYASALDELLQNGPLREQLAAQNRARCVKLYTHDRMFHAYRGAYERALGRAIEPAS
jgi:glycosyltransferase involved in cell wall biosynthesis